LGVQVSDQKLEKLFGQFDKDESGMIDYTEFKQCWLMYAHFL
jgi:Ca2+-binding EF-hand superfamily protein